MQTAKTYNWGILGAGKIARKFTEDLHKVPGANVYAVASRSLERAEEFAETNRITNAYGSYLDLVNDKEVDVIYIATPHVFHFEHSLLCIQHKKAVLCEKPLAMNREQVMEMITAAKREKVFFMEALWTYFLPHFQFVLELIESKKYGELQQLTADFGFNAPFDREKRIYNKKLGGGSLLDVGIYPVFAALTFMGIPEEIMAKTSIGETGVDESSEIQFKYTGGKKAQLNSSINKNTPTEAILKFENALVTINSRFHEPSSVTIKSNENTDLLKFDVKSHGYNFEAIHVQEMLNDNRIESTVMTFQKSLDLIGLLDTVRSKIGLYY